jgi:NAD(P)-dependent dehydrogenase (short-subunit alcohol dehydrogenase family)
VTDPLLGGRLALVTGASRGIGRAVADALRAAGAHVVRLARSLTDGAGRGWTDYPCDVSDAAAVERVLERVLADLGVPDIAVQNAGLFLLKPLEETTPEEFARSLAVNVGGPFLVARALVPHLRRKGSGHLVTIGSVADHRGLPGNAAYAAAKFGVRGLHEVLAAELRGAGVRLTLGSPGPVDTAMWDPVDPDRRPGFTPRAAMMRADDVAQAVLFAVTRPARVEVTELRLMPAPPPG